MNLTFGTKREIFKDSVKKCKTCTSPRHLTALMKKKIDSDCSPWTDPVFFGIRGEDINSVFMQIVNPFS